MARKKLKRRVNNNVEQIESDGMLTALEYFINGMLKYKVLTAQEERDLAIEYKTASNKRKEEIRTIFVNANQRFAYKLAKEYSNDSNLMDLISESLLGLLDAFETYDETKGRFSTHSFYYIKRRIVYYTITFQNIVRKSNCQKTFGLIEKAKAKLLKENGYEPSNAEIRECLEHDFNVKVASDGDMFEYKEVSINDTYDDEDTSAFENSTDFVKATSVINDCEVNHDSEYNKELINRLMSCLNDSEKEIISMAYGLKYEGYCMPTEDISENLGISEAQVRNYKNRAMEKMMKFAKIGSLVLA